MANPEGALRVLVLFGGRSGEHEVSVQSARLVAESLDRLGHHTVGVGVTRRGRTVHWDPLSPAPAVPEDADPFALEAQPHVLDIDVAFPVLHGPYGEDGCVQGLFELADVPYVGARVEGSVICMDKVLQKRLFAGAGIPVVEFVEIRRADWPSGARGVAERVASLGFPCFAKPAHLGSSVGISKVALAADLAGAVERALRHDDVVLVEAFGGPREVEVGVLARRGGGVDVSVPGEPVARGEFYDYRSKYGDDGCELRVPANVPQQVREEIRSLATAAFAVSRCAGLARVDFFWDPGAPRLIVNEINSIPGMTPTSMFPRVWAASGMPYPHVVQRLLDDARDRHAHRARLEAARTSAHDEEIDVAVSAARPSA